MNSRPWDIQRIVFSTTGCLIVITVMLQMWGPVKTLYNRTSSVDLGIYVGIRGNIDADLVLLPAPKRALELGCTTKDAMLLKHVVARAGDQVCLFNRVLIVDGMPYSKTPTHSSTGEPLSLAFDGCMTVPKDHVFVATPHPRSCDSRYFGPQHTDAFWGNAYPLITWK